jgi:hypothetical protein
MKAKKPSIENLVEAIILKDSGESYSEVIEAYNLLPNQYARFINQDMDSILNNPNTPSRETLSQIASDPNRRLGLFRMDDAFIKRQYDRMNGKIPGESQYLIAEGTLSHPENIKTLVVYALTLNNPKLESTDRKEVIETMKGFIANNLRLYLNTVGLRAVAECPLVKESGHPALEVLKIFDRYYQEKTGDKSLFDLTQKEHIHTWGKDMHAPGVYWTNPSNVEEAAYHILTEANPLLGSSDRKVVLQVIKSFPEKLHNYFLSLDGMAAIMRKGDGPNSSLEIIKAFDRVYQKKTGDVSLFEEPRPEPNHLMISGKIRNKII